VYKIRGAFVAPPGKLLIDADYDQLEMKLMADLSEEQAMIDAINSGKDMHCNTAALMYNVPYEAVAEAKRKDDAKEPLSSTDRQLLDFRSKAKALGFGLLYGEGSNKLAGQLGISRKEAEELIARFFTPFPAVKEFIDDLHDFVTANGYVPTLAGRPRHLRDGLEKAGAMAYFQVLRKAQNAAVQGSAADVVRQAMLFCESDEELRSLGCEMLMQVHDELIFECPEKNTPRAMRRIQYLMESPYKGHLRVKLTASPGCGFTWIEAK
jgi:DNA polymerase-1